MLRLHTENKLSSLPESASKVCVVVLGGGGWVEREFSDRLWLSISLALAKPNKNIYVNCGHYISYLAAFQQSYISG